MCFSAKLEIKLQENSDITVLKPFENKDERITDSHFKLVIKFIECISINRNEWPPWKFQVCPARQSDENNKCWEFLLMWESLNN